MTGKISAELKIQNQKGLHARAAAAFVRTVENFDVDVNVSRAGQTVGGSSIMGLMILSASKGTKILIEAVGPQAEEFIKAIKALINGKFGED
ncbi:MAG: HPr family phosphocarrier protein [Lactobacillaceae bacterium]|jgi:phosphocarrier protein|nr:HPr family phosphocarrier protein [Lactobacillaceae bacterium]